MAIIGWLVCVLGGLWAISAAAGMAWLCVGFSGKVGPTPFVLAVVGLLLWYAAYVNSPFTITLTAN